MADTKSSPPPPAYPQQNYPNQQPQQTYFNGPAGQPPAAGYANVQTQGQYVPQSSPYPPQGQHYPQQQPGQTHTVLVPVQQQPNVLVTQPQGADCSSYSLIKKEDAFDVEPADNFF
ncbi:hypothetical protein BU17DRAFT_60460 [Hysterangium stoloniferum]|nr:hypothetical protein BU17DRAFT_60460 [Hysterangium stoloniferum]